MFPIIVGFLANPARASTCYRHVPLFHFVDSGEHLLLFSFGTFSFTVDGRSFHFFTSTLALNKHFEIAFSSPDFFRKLSPLAVLLMDRAANPLRSTVEFCFQASAFFFAVGLPYR